MVLQLGTVMRDEGLPWGRVVLVREGVVLVYDARRVMRGVVRGVIMDLGAVGRVCVVLVRGAVVLDEGVVMGCGVLILFEVVVFGRDVAVHCVFGGRCVVVIAFLVLLDWGVACRVVCCVL